jgi:hypothetical protein
VKIYSLLKELQGEFIPYFFWSGFLNRGEYYGVVTSLGNLNCVSTDSEKDALIYSLQKKGVVHNDEHNHKFIRTPEGKLLMIDFGQSNLYTSYISSC